MQLWAPVRLVSLYFLLPCERCILCLTLAPFLYKTVYLTSRDRVIYILMLCSPLYSPVHWSLSDKKKDLSFGVVHCFLNNLHSSKCSFWPKFCHIYLCINRHSPTTLLGTKYDCLLTQTANQPASTQCIQACRRGEDDLLNSKAASEKNGH